MELFCDRLWVSLCDAFAWDRIYLSALTLWTPPAAELGRRDFQWIRPYG